MLAGIRRVTRRRFLIGSSLLGLSASTSLTATAAPTVVTSRSAPLSIDQRPLPIEHVVILFRENRTYDTYFGTFPGGNGIPAGVTLPPSTDVVYPDPPHSHADALRVLGHDAATSPTGDVMFDPPQVAEYWDLARRFTLCDEYFTEVLGASMPNHLMLIAANAASAYNVGGPSQWSCPQVCYDDVTLPDRLEDAGLTWKAYWGGDFSAFRMIRHLQGSPNIVDSSQFVADAASGNLPNVSWLQAEMDESEHPGNSTRAGVVWAMQQIDAAMAGPGWKRTAIFVIWDDWGGFYDHVTPPLVERGADGTQFRYGFRSPCLVISPHAKQGYISHRTYSHVSTLAFCGRLFKLPPLTARDAAADPMFDCFNLWKHRVFFPVG